MARKKAPSKKCTARRSWVFDLLRTNQSIKQISETLGVTERKVRRDVSWMREKLGSRAPFFIPPKGTANLSGKRAIRIVRLIDFAKEAIEGRATVAPDRRGKGPGNKIPVEKERKIIALLKRNPKMLNPEIASKTGVSVNSVRSRRIMLVEREEILKQDNVYKQSQRKAERKTNVLGKQQRQKFLEQKREKIEKMAFYTYKTNRVAFDFANMLPENSVEDIVDKIDWRLQVFNPKRMKGAEQTKLERYFNSALKYAGLDLKRKAWKKYRAISSIEQGMEEKKDMKSKLEARQEVKEMTVKMAEKISRKLKLNPLEKAIFFGKAANMTNTQIAKMLGCSDALISIIRKKMEKRLKA